MTLLDHGQPADTTTKKRHTGLIAVVAVLVVALLAAGAWLFVDRQHQPLSAEEQQAAIMDVVTAYRDGVEAGDRDAILAPLTDDVTYLYAGSYGASVMTPLDQYIGLGEGDLMAFDGDPVFFGDLQVAIHSRSELPKWLVGGGTTEPGRATYLFTLREVDGQLKIAAIVLVLPESE